MVVLLHTTRCDIATYNHGVIIRYHNHGAILLPTAGVRDIATIMV
jgi:hypothetical protein